MNERIKELAAKSNFGYMENDNVVYDHRLEKFALLIVRECAVQAEEESSWPYSSFGKKIKEHFGVE